VTAEELSVGIWILTVLAWACAVFLVWKAWGARIGALTERAIVAIGLSIFGTIYSAAVYNTDIAQWLDNAVVKFWVRLGVVALLFLPIIWAALYLTGHLGDDGHGGEA
jgi:hypothetical protein